MQERLRPWLAPPGLWFITMPWVALTLLHYLTPAHHITGSGEHLDLHLFHDIYRRLYYFPILSAALMFGLRGGLLAAAVVSVAYLPHVIHRWSEIPTQNFDALFEIVLYHGAGALIGSLATTLRRQRETLLRTDQLRGAGELAAGMAHEVRNPLASIKGAAERLHRGTLADGERDELLRILEVESTRLDGVVRVFLLYTRPAPLVQTKADLNAVVNETAALVGPTAQRRGVRIDLKLDPALVSQRMDPAKIKQALLNLLLNAVQASPDGATVTVTTRLAGRRAEVLVQDHGPGLPEEVRRSLFTPFTTTKEGGTGLGLPIARQILEAHGGGITLNGAPEGGTLARVYLPAGKA